MDLDGKSSAPALAAALFLFAIWTLATWVLEGRIDTFLRPEAVVDRAIYAIVANLLIGIAVAMALLRMLIRRGWLSRQSAGFGRSTPSAVRLTSSQGKALGAGPAITLPLESKREPWQGQKKPPFQSSPRSSGASSGR